MSEIVLAHQPCEDCGSSDAKTYYADGSSYCFSCNIAHRGEEAGEVLPVAPKKAKGNFLQGNLNPLPQRGITLATCSRFGYFTATSINGEPCQVANYYDDNGELLGQKLRFKDKTFSVIGNLHNRFFGQHLFSKGKKLVITEGEIDCLTVSQITGNRYPVVSIPNGCQSAKRVFQAQMEWLNNFEEVIVMFDMDDPGRAATEAVTRILPPGKLKVATLPLKDPNECLKQGRADAVLDGIYQAKPYKPDGIVNGDELWDKLANETDEDTKGYPFPWDIDLQEKTQGVRKGEILLITAGTGIGKTTFVRQIAHSFGVHLGLKVGMLMLEENILRTAKGLMSLHCGKRLSLNRHLVTESEYKEIYDEVLGKGNFVFYEHFGSVESDNLLSKIRYLAVAEQCDFIVLDHITIAISGLDIDNERKATDVLMTNLRSLAEETGVGLIIISHLKRVDGTPAEEGGAISLAHLRGSQGLSQLSDTVLALERNQQDTDENTKNLVRLRILKNRFKGETGISGYLRYDKETDTLMAAKAPRKTTECPFGDATEEDY